MKKVILVAGLLMGLMVAIAGQAKAEDWIGIDSGIAANGSGLTAVGFAEYGHRENNGAFRVTVGSAEIVNITDYYVNGLYVGSTEESETATAINVEVLGMMDIGEYVTLYAGAGIGILAYSSGGVTPDFVVSTGLRVNLGDHISLDSTTKYDVAGVSLASGVIVRF
jgi:hypothetical protein